jgi:serine/threonine protein kinase
VIGKTVSHYNIIDKIGSGGMGTVYKAQDIKLERFVALKFLPPHLSHAEDEKLRFIHEAKAASALDHPNICTIYEIGETEPDKEEPGGQLFIAMACYEGESLRTRLNHGPLSIKEAVDIAIQMARGLEKAHSKKIVHRDIKPANVLITEDGQVKIVDFGLAKLAGLTLITKQGTTLGTISYMSPEQTEGIDIDHRADIWALGVVFYEMLGGERPFKGDYDQAVMYSILNEDPKPIKDLNSEIPKELQQIINRALQKDPDLRYASVGEMLRDLQAYSNRFQKETRKKFELHSSLYRLSQPKIAIPLIAGIIIIILVFIWFFNYQTKINWAQEEAIPEARRLIDAGLQHYIEAYKLAEKAEQYIPNDEKLKEVLDQCAIATSIITTPSGAKIFMKEYDKPDQDWTYIGVTPIDSIRMAAGYFRTKVEKKGYRTITALSAGFTFSTEKGFIPKDINFILDEEDKIPPGMVRVTADEEYLDDFLIDRYEVTNKQFKEFINQDGYQNKEYWKHDFIQNGKVLSWESAMSIFVDQSGRPGPATWQGGDYPDGHDQYPVCGISWYEAAAYAIYVGKSLPTISHWDRARGITSLYLNSFLIKSQSNFGTKGPVPVGHYTGITAFGASDMAGNVREWCWNETRLGRCIRGGAWNDNLYMFDNISQLSPLDRSPKNGFRCVLYLEKDKIADGIFDRLDNEKFTRDYSKEKPVSDAIFQVYKNQFSYDTRDLNSQLELREESSEYWTKERISFDAAYGNERMLANLYIPKNTNPPYQVVIFFPGSSARSVSSSINLEIKSGFQYYLSHIVKNHRVVVYPIYKGTFERMLAPHKPWGRMSHKLAEYRIQLTNDLSRVIDYLETRKDIAHDQIAYYGLSWGGAMGLLIPAVEDRLKVNMLIVGGLPDNRTRPEVDYINFISRIKIPTLMLNGRYDLTFSHEDHVKPAFDFLGTPAPDKKLVMYDTDHFIPRNELIKETLDWLDRYLGGVK